MSNHENRPRGGMGYDTTEQTMSFETTKQTAVFVSTDGSNNHGTNASFVEEYGADVEEQDRLPEIFFAPVSNARRQRERATTNSTTAAELAHLVSISMFRRFHELATRPRTLKDQYKGIFPEFAGTALIYFTLIMVSTFVASDPPTIAILAVSIAVFLVYGAMVDCVKSLSGGHFNPLITMASMIYGDTYLLPGICYLLAQFFGCLLAGGVARRYLGNVFCLATPAIGVHHSTWGAFWGEFWYGLVILMAYYWAIERAALSAWAYSAVVAIGHMLLLPISGASLNMFRFLGSAIWSGCWQKTDHIYFVSHLLLLFFIWIIRLIVGRYSRSKAPKVQ